ncbi:haloacid dehalogenase [Candidatus Nanopelagicus hibericus]|uniref:Haloacid dehalogenase n=1 Tax=Candidatus Nanopelagicus hibericus TaxID=1884915 RepID=A0A249KAM3_9ACTN|nr:HAD family hydrolase [Candidatus Nanopelagicus hibericus]ASY13853.1 haloacid dehalogenase [Candidatus Nanopelagicus hibericus]
MSVLKTITGRRPKLIGTDLDGTIVANYGFISERTKIAFTAANAAGIHIYFVTGRPIRWMAEIKENFNFGLGICGNGAMLYDFLNEKILEQWLFSVEAQLETVKRLRTVIPPVTFAVEVNQQFHREKKYVPRWDIGADNVGVDQIEEVITAPALKILARCQNSEFSSDEMLVLANKELTGIATVTHSNSTDSLLEISADGVSKGATLAKVASRHGLTADDCVTFGDNPNDFSMLTWSSRSWAMADGHPDLMKYAKFQTDPHQEDGVAKVVERLLELPE